MAQSFTTANLTTSAGLAPKMVTYYDKRMLDRLRPKLIFHPYGEEKNLPKNNGKTVQWFKRVDGSANTTPITEGVTPNPISMSATSLTATLAQYAEWTQTSDFIQMTSIDEEINHAVDVLSFKAARTLDALDRAVLDADTTNAIYGDGSVGSVGAVTAGMKLTGAVVREGVRRLKSKDAEGWSDGYALLVHPNNSFDLFADAATGGWQQMNTYVNVENPKQGVVGKYFGAFVRETTELTTANDGATAAKVYRAHMLAQGAYGTINFDGGVHILVKKASDADTSNPLNLYSTVGYKLAYANKLLDANRHVTLFLGSAN